METLISDRHDGVMMKALTLYSSVASGLMAGVFFAFSTFVMRALGALPAPQGIAAMQSLNRYAPNVWFMTVLFGTALTSLVVAVGALRDLGAPGAGWAVAGAGLYLVAVVLTVVFHVPRNDALDAVDPASAAGAELWARYLVQWTAGNHLRVLGPLGAAVAFALAWRAGR